MKRKIWIWTSCVILLGAIGLWAFSNDGSKSSEVETNQNVPTSPNPLVTIPDIDQQKNPLPVTVPDVNSEPPGQGPEKDGSASSSVPNVTHDTGTTISEPPVLQPEKEVTDIEVPINEPTPTPKPTEPPKPKPKETDKPQSPDTPPTYEEKETQPNKQQNEPQAGDKNESGKVFVPGFGWVEDQGGGTQETTVGKQGDQLTGNKVGSMD